MSEEQEAVLSVEKQPVEQSDEEKINYIPPSISDVLPSMVRNELIKLTAQKQEEFVEEFNRKSRSVGMAFVWWLVFGSYYGYLRKWGLQVVFWLTAGGFGIWAIIDLFRIQGMVRDYNKDVATDILRNLKAISS